LKLQQRTAADASTVINTTKNACNAIERKPPRKSISKKEKTQKKRKRVLVEQDTVTIVQKQLITSL